MAVMSEGKTCPKCGAKSEYDNHPTAIRLAGEGNIRIVDVGWRCSQCRHEWGFELIKSEQK
jgi:hypothetical protein